MRGDVLRAISLGSLANSAAIAAHGLSFLLDTVASDPFCTRNDLISKRRVGCV